jgi:catechol 2,3-dioxygenase-like lactoylglutathione lyase family enzyme
LTQFSHTIVYVADIQRTLSFYELAFGLAVRFVHESGLYAELDTGSTKLALASHALGKVNVPNGFRANVPSEPPAGIVFSLMVEDVPQAFRQAVAAGAQRIAEPKLKSWGQHLACVRDLDGVLIELNKWIG